MIATLDNNTLAFVAADAVVGQDVTIWEVKTGRTYTARIVSLR